MGLTEFRAKFGVLGLWSLGFKLLRSLGSRVVVSFGFRFGFGGVENDGFDGV